MRHLGEKGIGLIELMIALALGMMVTAAVLGLQRHSQLAEIGVLRSQQATQLSEEVRMVLGNRKRCTLNFKGLAFDPTSASGIAIEAINEFDLNANKGRAVVSAGVETKLFSVSGLQLLPRAALGNQRYEALLTMTMTTQATARMGSDRLERSVPLVIQIKSGKIQECSSLADNESITAEAVCNSLGSGLSQYDPATGTCRPKEKKCLAGPTPFTATCPTGYEPYPAFYDQPCRWIEKDPDSAGIDPNYRGETRTYADGTVWEAGPGLGWADYDRTNHVCSCVYVPEADPNQFNCEICCTPITN